MVHAIFYLYQTSGACAGICVCDCMHQMEKSALLTYFDNSALCCVLCFFSRAWFYFQSFDLLITILLKNCNCVNCFLTGNLYFDKFKLINLNITVFRGSGYVSYLGVSPHFGRLLVKHWGLTYLKRQLNAQSLSLN